MSDWLGVGTDLPWWAWALMLIGLIALVGVIGALFLPDWPTPDFTIGLDAEPGSDDFVAGVATFLNDPVFRGGEVTLLQNGDGFYPVMLQAIRDARDTINFETYIFEPDEIGLQFIEAFKERARAGVEVRLLIDGFGGMKLKKRYRDDLTRAGVMVQRFRPLSLRNLVRIYRREHRRATVIDGKIGFTGGAAIS
jgi:cardiolipin synthase